MTSSIIKKAARTAAQMRLPLANETGTTVIKTMQALIIMTLAVTLIFVLLRSLYLVPKLKKDMAAHCASVLEKEKAFMTSDKETFLAFGADNAAQSLSALGATAADGLIVRAEIPFDNQVAVYVYPNVEKFSWGIYPPLIYTCSYTNADTKPTQSMGFQGADGTVSKQ